MPRSIMGGHRSLEDAGAGGRQLDIGDFMPVSRKRRLSGPDPAKPSKKPYLAPTVIDETDEDNIAVAYHRPLQSSSTDRVNATVSPCTPSRRSSTASLPSDPCAMRFRASNDSKMNVDVKVEGYPSSQSLEMIPQGGPSIAETPAFECQPTPTDAASIATAIDGIPVQMAHLVAPLLAVAYELHAKHQILEEQLAEMTMQNRRYQREMTTNFRMLSSSVGPSQSASNVDTVHLL